MMAMRPNRQTYIILALAFFVFLFGAHAQSATDQHDAIASALRSQEFGKALDMLQTALKRSPGNAQLWTMQGVAYSGLGRKGEALVSFRSALKIVPNDIFALHSAIQIEYDAGNPAAVPLLQRLLRLRPDDPTGHGMLAVLLFQQGVWTAAATHFEKAGGLVDSQAEARHAYAVCLVKLKRFDQAAKLFQRSVALQPGDKRERHLLAAVQLMAEEPQAAVATLEPLLGYADTDVETLELASSAFEEAHDTERAVDLLRRGILRNPGEVNLYLDFANLTSVHQAFQLGLNVVNEGLNQQPKAAKLYFARGVLHVQLGQYEQAEADFERAYELDPNQSLSAAAQGLAAVNANDLDRALATVQTKLKRTPADATLLYLEADVLIKKGAEPGSPEFQQALRSARKAVALRPTLGPAHTVLAKLYLQTGRYSDAAEQCRKALAIDPKDQTSVYRLIQALRKTALNNAEIPVLLKRLALLRQEALKEEREQYRFRIVEGDAAPAASGPH